MNHHEMKTAVITGGASGIGLAIAEKFVKEQIRCILIGRNKDKLQKASDLLGPLAFGVSFDLTGLSGLPGLVSSIEKEYGKIDILVNNAGIHLKKPLTEVSDEEFQKVVMTNLNAVFSLSREMAKVMSARKSGNIINISSMASQYGIPYVIAYTAAKSAVEGMTRAMAVELSPLGIRVNCIAPGFIQTDMSAGALKNDPERQRKVLSRTPMGRLGNPSEVADAVYFLASESSSFITGVILPVDGGNAIGF